MKRTILLDHRAAASFQAERVSPVVLSGNEWLGVVCPASRPDGSSQPVQSVFDRQLTLDGRRWEAGHRHERSEAVRRRVIGHLTLVVKTV
jgi:hypothetical protein